MPSKYRAFKEAADRIVELERDLAAAKENLQSADEDRLRMRAQTARLDAALIEKDISIAARDAELAEVMKWKEAVINELIVAHIYSQAHDDSPRKAIQDAITWNCQVALDPAVSSDAQRLRDTHLQRAEAAERERDRYKREHEADKTGQLISYLNVLAQENKTLRRMSHVDRAEKAERERDEWKRKAEEAARDAEKLTLDAVEQRLLNWRQSTMNKSGDRLALDDFMGKESIDDLVDYVCDEFAAIAAKGEA